MLFNSLEFLIFLPIVFLLYWFFLKSIRHQNSFIIVASYVFYGWWDYRFLILISFTTLCSYYSGLMIEKGKTKKGKKICAIANIIINLLILGVFKYFNFFVENLISVLSCAGITLHPYNTIKLILPVGISFYTFQAISYTIDVYCGKIKATCDILSFFAYMSFFPQLVAGPIERATNLLPQFQTFRVFDYTLAVNGTRQILWGLFKKIVIADRCALAVNDIFSNYNSYSSITLVIGAFLFAFQIYGDFSGYSDIAIGTAKLFGIRLKRNFNVPYFSQSIVEFWKRWHISLNTWFVDYVYIPLGGNRKGNLMKIRNILIIFLLSGLWHGANWTFICWGGYHALLFVPFLFINATKTRIRADDGRFVLSESLRNAARMLLTFVLVVVGWIIFRADNMNHFFAFMSNILFWKAGYISVISKATPLLIVFMLAIEWLGRHLEHPMGLFNCGILAKYVLLRRCLYVMLTFIIIYFAGRQATFIYFQF